MIMPLLTYLNLNFELPFTMWNKCSPEKYVSKQGFQRTSTYLHYQAKLEKEFQVLHGFEGFATQIMCSCRIWKCFMQAVCEIHWIEVYVLIFLFMLFGGIYLTSNKPWSFVLFVDVSKHLFHVSFPSKLENFQFCDNENRWSGQQFSIGLGWYFYPQMDKYNLSLSNCQAKWSSIPALDWIKKMCVTYFFDFFQTTYIDKTHQSTINKICSKKGNFFTIVYWFQICHFFFKL